MTETTLTLAGSRQTGVRGARQFEIVNSLLPWQPFRRLYFVRGPCGTLRCSQAGRHRCSASGPGGREKEEASKKPARCLQQACNMLATCLQLARYSGTATVLPRRRLGATSVFLRPKGRAPTRPKAASAEISILLAATALLWVAGCKPKAHVTPPPPMVEVAPVTQADVPIYHEWIGVLDGLVNAQIRAQVTGYLITQDYREGDPIKKGDLLFQIDPRPFKAALDQAKGLLAQAEARSGKTALDVKRYAPLVKDRAISQEEYDDAVQADLEAKAAVVSAKAQVEQAQLNLGFTQNHLAD